MKARMLMSFAILWALAVLPLASDTKSAESTAAAGNSTSKIITEKCSSCGKSVQMKHLSGDNWEILCPACNQPMKLTKTAANNFSAQCDHCDKQISMEKLQNGTMMLKCPGCGHEMALKCPDCGDKGTLKVASVYGGKTRLECANCHKEVDVK